MARVSGALRNQGGPFRRLFLGIVYFLTRRRLDGVIVPGQVTAHHPQISGDTSRWNNHRWAAS
jgi:hypothetical protein